jgi:hypothetical protein
MQWGLQPLLVVSYCVSVVCCSRQKNMFYEVGHTVELIQYESYRQIVSVDVMVINDILMLSFTYLPTLMF